MISLSKIKEKIERQNKNDKQLFLDYKINNSLSIITHISKRENLLFLLWISKIKELNNKQISELIDKYLKLNYYCPSINKSFKKNN